jgi:Bacterial Ig-like domain (group 3)/FG-GAP repeat
MTTVARLPTIRITSGGIRALEDFNGDGIVDIAAASLNDSPVSIYSGVLSPRLTLTGSPNPASLGQDVVLAAASSFADATGTISFTDTSTGTNPGSAPLSGGTATFHVIQPALGIHRYQASYGGDGKYGATSAPVVSVTVQEAIGIALSASPNPALPGQPVKLTATLSTSPGNANVLFLDGVTPLGYQELYSGPNSNKATLTTILAAGVHQLRAVFPPYSGYESTSASYTETVTALRGGQLLAGASCFDGANPTAIAAADFNGDGYTDLAAPETRIVRAILALMSERSIRAENRLLQLERIWLT